MNGFIYVVTYWAILKTYSLLLHRIVLYIVEDRSLYLTLTLILLAGIIVLASSTLSDHYLLADRSFLLFFFVCLVLPNIAPYSKLHSVNVVELNCNKHCKS